MKRKNNNDLSFCCLGVLCDLHSQETGNPWTGTSYLEEEVSLPKEVQKWAGLTTCDPQVGCDDRSKRISYWNDDEGKTFAELADMIEEQF